MHNKHGYNNNWKRKTIEKERSKDIMLNIKQRRLRAITLQEAVEKNPILVL